MMKSLVSLFILLNVLHSDAAGICNQIPFLPNDTVYQCYVTDAFSESGENYIKIMPVQFLWGNSAVIEARKDGVADFDLDSVTKDTTWWVPNDYYIVDRVKSEFKFIISDKVKISISDQAVLKKITIKELLLKPSYYKIQLYDRYTHEKIVEMDYYPYEIVVEKGKVTIIQQVYVP